jgi:hypothetical protein
MPLGPTSTPQPNIRFIRLRGHEHHESSLRLGSVLGCEDDPRWKFNPSPPPDSFEKTSRIPRIYPTIGLAFCSCPRCDSWRTSEWLLINSHAKPPPPTKGETLLRASPPYTCMRTVLTNPRRIVSPRLQILRRHLFSVSTCQTTPRPFVPCIAYPSRPVIPGGNRVPPTASEHFIHASGSCSLRDEPMIQLPISKCMFNYNKPTLTNPICHHVLDVPSLIRGAMGSELSKLYWTITSLSGTRYFCAMQRNLSARSESYRMNEQDGPC